MEKRRLRILNFNLLIFIFLIFPISASPAIFSERMKKPDSYFLQKSIIDLTSPSLLKSKLNHFLQKTFPGRSYQSSGHKKIDNFFNEFEEENELKFERQNFTPNSKWAKENLRREFDEKVRKNFSPSSATFRKWSNFISNLSVEYNQIQLRKFTNYIYQKRGASTQKTLIISANIDSIGQDSKTKQILHQNHFFGASDNASSVISLMELIKVIHKIELPYNVMVVFFDLQEFGNLGSHAFVTEYLKTGVTENYIHLNSLMLSKLNSSNNKKSFRLYGKASQIFGKDVMSNIKGLVPEAKVRTVSENYAGSDTGPFHDYGIPSLTLMGLDESDQKKVIHDVSDSVESVDFYHYHLGTKVLFSLVLSLLYPL